MYPIFQRNGVKEAEHYRMDNAPKKIYKFIPFFDNGNSKVNNRNIEIIEEIKEAIMRKYDISSEEVKSYL